MTVIFNMDEYIEGEKIRLEMIKLRLEIYNLEIEIKHKLNKEGFTKDAVDATIENIKKGY